MCTLYVCVQCCACVGGGVPTCFGRPSKKDRVVGVGGLCPSPVLGRRYTFSVLCAFRFRRSVLFTALCSAPVVGTARRVRRVRTGGGKRLGALLGMARSSRTYLVGGGGGGGGGGGPYRSLLQQRENPVSCHTRIPDTGSLSSLLLRLRTTLFWA